MMQKNGLSTNPLFFFKKFYEDLFIFFRIYKYFFLFQLLKKYYSKWPSFFMNKDFTCKKNYLIKKE